MQTISRAIRPFTLLSGASLRRTVPLTTGSRLPSLGFQSLRFMQNDAKDTPSPLGQDKLGATKPSSSTSSSLTPVVVAAMLGGIGWYYYMNNMKKVNVNDALAHVNQKALDKKALNPDEFVSFELKEIHPVSHNTHLYRFALPESDMELGLHVASCILTKYVSKELNKESKPKVVVRPYTPVSEENTRGYFDLVVKRYENGNMSKHISSLKPGDKLDVKGPIFKYSYKPNMHETLGLIAGGTGITPMYQIIRKVLRDPTDKTSISLLFANVSDNDILLRDELEALAKQYPDRFHIYYTVDKAPKDWTFGEGYITPKMVQEHLPAPQPSDGDVPKVKVMVCGPLGMMKLVSGPKANMMEQGPLTGILKELGYTENDVFKF
ncbi:NADH-cytochrome b5 reductase [Dispira simplex]|nr:NADH-cytochrome b5 reductase [Dispira simplex]